MATAAPVQPVLIYNRIAQNRRKTVLLVAMTIVTLIPFVIGLAYLLAQTVVRQTGMSTHASAAYEARMESVMQNLEAEQRGRFRDYYQPRVAAMRAREAANAGLEDEITVVMALGIMAGLGIIYWGIASAPTAKILALAGAQPATSSENEARRLLENLAIGAGLPPPKLYVIESPVPNAFAAGSNPQHAVVAVTRGALHLFDHRELEGVLAHELSHIGNYDTRLNTVVTSIALLLRLPYKLLRAELRDTTTRITANRSPWRFLISVALTPVGVYVFFAAPVVAAVIRAAVSRSREFLADADAALLTRYPEGLMRALAKIAGAGSLVSNVNPVVSHLYFSNPVEASGFMAVFSGRLLATHPPIGERVAVLMRCHGNVPASVIENAAEAGKKYRLQIASAPPSDTFQAPAAKDDFAVLNMGNPMGRVHRVLSPDVVPIYDLPNLRSVTVARVKPGTLIVVFDDPGPWRQVNTADETFGYMSRSVKLAPVDLMPPELYDPVMRAAAEAKLPSLAAMENGAKRKATETLTRKQVLVVTAVAAVTFSGILSALFLFGGR